MKKNPIGVWYMIICDRLGITQRNVVRFAKFLRLILIFSPEDDLLGLPILSFVIALILLIVSPSLRSAGILAAAVNLFIVYLAVMWGIVISVLAIVSIPMFIGFVVRKWFESLPVEGRKAKKAEEYTNGKSNAYSDPEENPDVLVEAQLSHRTDRFS